MKNLMSTTACKCNARDYYTGGMCLSAPQLSPRMLESLREMKSYTLHTVGTQKVFLELDHQN